MHQHTCNTINTCLEYLNDNGNYGISTELHDSQYDKLRTVYVRIYYGMCYVN